MTFDFTSVRKQPKNFSQINKILEKAFCTLLSAKQIIRSDKESGFTLAYESMLKTTMALMFSNGLRPRVKLGHHITMVSYARYILGDDFSRLTATYEKMRKKRNIIIYDVAFVSDSEAKNACKSAEKYFKVVEEKISNNNPQQKLWKP